MADMPPLLFAILAPTVLCGLCVIYLALAKAAGMETPKPPRWEDDE